jgi:transcriptional regulator with XRE-family HTH domain
MDTTTQQEDPRAASRRAIRLITARRCALSMSAQELSDATERLGLMVSRSVIANFESGRRAAITVDELIVLSRALGLNPVKLLDVDDCETCGGNPPRGFTCNSCEASAR